ncbi:MAG: PhoPQ-activated pathogenicity-related family protein [Myxacorys chilensis ATA2-1-KO14]|jgi:PhoPQ-activated pathogenicity-related protein|nr:PhoPQ-activated pathogenicity-related family protein [Myxacorys chilensis ATA2-1-KO14]
MGESLAVKITSQRWKGMDWVHELQLFKPSTYSSSQSQGLLFLSGGAQGGDATHRNEDARFEGELTLFAIIAQETSSIVGVVSHTLCQPMFGGLGENELISHSFSQFLASGRPDWPVLLPMVGAVRRAMDVTQRLATDTWAAKVEQFTLAGFSKRGWAAWLTAAVDERVNAIAPIMMDFFDLPRQITCQRSVWGSLSPALQPFETLDIPNRLQTSRGQQLLDMVDVVRWTTYYNVARAIISATNDEYCPVQASNLYIEQIPGRSYRSMIPNTSHGSLAYVEILGIVGALHRQVALGEVMPNLTGKAWIEDGALCIMMTSNAAPIFKLWIAHAPSLDLRNSLWSPIELFGESKIRIALPVQGIMAIFGQAKYNKTWGCFALTTQVWTVGPQGLIEVA